MRHQSRSNRNTNKQKSTEILEKKKSGEVRDLIRNKENWELPSSSPFRDETRASRVALIRIDFPLAKQAKERHEKRKIGAFENVFANIREQLSTRESGDIRPSKQFLQKKHLYR